MKRKVTLWMLSLSIVFLLAMLMSCDLQPEPDSEAESETESSDTGKEKTETATADTEQDSTEPETADTVPEETEPDKSETVPAHQCAFIKFEGIDGESQIEGHEGWSEIVAFSQSIAKPGDLTTTTRSRGDVVLEDVVVIKQVDKISPKLGEAICKGTVFPKVEIHLTGPSEGSPLDGTFYAYELKNVRITSYKVTGSNPLAYALIAPAPDLILPYSGPFIVQAVDAPMEEMSLNFEEIKVTYTESDSTGKSKGNIEYSWKVEEGES